ncbi:hypothetical protein V2G26_013293 [Clonostachys chloroleuca]
MMLCGAQKVQKDTDHEEQQPEEENQHTVEETKDEFETVNGAAINGSPPLEGSNRGIHDEESCDKVQGQIVNDEVAEPNDIRPDIISSNYVDSETTRQSSREPEDSGRDSHGLDSEFEPEIEDDSEEVEDGSTLGARVNEEFVMPGSKRKLSHASCSQPRKKPCQWEKSTIKCQSKERTIRFKEVYENTRAGRKEIIVQFPASNGRWYIIRCEEHGIEFSGSNPLMDAAFHLGSLKHDKYSKAYKDVIEKMGIRVKYCTKSRAEQNNNAITNKAVQKNSPISMDRTSDSSRNTEDTLYDEIGPEISPYDDFNEGNENSYVRRQPGDICLVYHCGEYIPVLVLPLDNMLGIGINSDIKTLKLVQTMPECCIYNQGTGKYMWKDGYEDGGRLESFRAHPGLCLTQSTLELCSPLWVKGTDLGNFDLEDPIIMKQEYYQPLLRLILQVHNNQAASNVITPGNQYPCSSGNIADGTDGENCVSPRVHGGEIQPVNSSKQGDDVEDGLEDARCDETDRRVNQEDNRLTSDDENDQTNGPSKSSELSSRGLQQDGGQVDEPQPGSEASMDRSLGLDESHTLSQQPVSNHTSAAFDDRQINGSSTNPTTPSREATARESDMSHAEPGDESIATPSTEKRSLSPPPTIVRSASIQTISSNSVSGSDSSDSSRHSLIPRSTLATKLPKWRATRLASCQLIEACRKKWQRIAPSGPAIIKGVSPRVRFRLKDGLRYRRTVLRQRDTLYIRPRCNIRSRLDLMRRPNLEYTTHLFTLNFETSLNSNLGYNSKLIINHGGVCQPSTMLSLKLTYNHSFRIKSILALITHFSLPFRLSYWQDHSPRFTLTVQHSLSLQFPL